MLEPRNSKRPLFGRIFQPLIDALRDTDMNTRLDFLPIDFIVRKCNHMVMEWSKLYSNENNEHLPYEDFLALNEAALTIPVMNGYTTSDATSHLSPDKTRSRENTSSTRRPTTTSTAGGNAAAKGGAREVLTGRKSNSRHPTRRTTSA